MNKVRERESEEDCKEHQAIAQIWKSSAGVSFG